MLPVVPAVGRVSQMAAARWAVKKRMEVRRVEPHPSLQAD
jgi:hypothetical protein